MSWILERRGLAKLSNDTVWIVQNKEMQSKENVVEKYFVQAYTEWAVLNQIKTYVSVSIFY